MKMLWAKKRNNGSKDQLHIESHKGKTWMFAEATLCNELKPAYCVCTSVQEE